MTSGVYRNGVKISELIERLNFKLGEEWLFLRPKNLKLEEVYRGVRFCQKYTGNNYADGRSI